MAKQHNNNIKINPKILKERGFYREIIDWFMRRYGNEDVSIDCVIKRLRKEKKNDIGCLFREFKLTGVCEWWCEDGELQWRKNYKNGKEHGLCEGWYENGQLQWRENYKNGKEHGLCEGWYENGQLDYRTNYKNGEQQ